MKMSNRNLALILLSALVSPPQAVFADIAPTTTVGFGDVTVFGSCNLAITSDEPYSHMNADCDIEKDGIAIAETPLSGFEIGFPRGPGEGIFSWNNLTTDPAMDGEEYCQIFYIPSTGKIQFGGPDESTEIDGDDSCEPPPEPIEAFYVPYCVGSYTYVYSLAQLIPGVHYSYRYETQPLLCFQVAVIE